MNSSVFTGVMLQTDEIGRQFQRLRGCVEALPDASIVISIDARSDLRVVHNLLADLFAYTGSKCLEFVLVINNYPPGSPPKEAGQYARLGANVVAVPNARRAGEVIVITSRALGVRAAQAEYTLHFDADVRIPDSTALIDWYIETLSRGYGLAYTRVDFYGLPKKWAIMVRLAIHDLVRWVKRTLLGMPTTRGSNYAIDRSLFLELYEAGKLTVDDFQVGPAVRLAGARSRYSGRPELRVSTSARMPSGRRPRLLPDSLHRPRYSIKATPTSFRPVERESWRGFDDEADIREKRALPPVQENRS